MSGFLVSPEAEEDVFEIWRYLFRVADVTIANRIEAELLNAFADLARMPGKGHRRFDLTNANVLFYTLYQYMVVYRRESPITILCVLHAKRNLKRILKKRL